MSETLQYDLVVLGGGPGGYAAALRAAELGQNVAMVEHLKVGGTCLHRGCIPTKALLHAAEVAENTKESEKFGVKASFEGIDAEAVLKYKNGVIDRNYKGLVGLVKARGIDTIDGKGVLASQDTVEVATDEGTVTLQGKNIVLATGSFTKTLPGLELGGRVIGSEEALNLDHVPSSAIILGGGVIGVEFASVWNSFGTEVTVVEALPHLVPLEDESISKTLERAFKKRKIATSLGVRFSGVEQTENGVKVSLEDGKTFEAEYLLVAVGRGPNTEGLGFAEQGVTLDRGFVIPNERLHTGVGNIYAIGDIVPGLQLAHRSFAHGIFVAEEIAGLNPVPLDEKGVPRVTYCDPEIFSVGITEGQAKEQFGADNVEVIDYNLGGNGKSVILGTTGFVKVVRQKDGPVVGIYGIGARLSEQAGEAQLIVNWEAFPEEVAQLIHAHPTQTEALGEAHLALAGKPLHFHS